MMMNGRPAFLVTVKMNPDVSHLIMGDSLLTITFQWLAFPVARHKSGKYRVMLRHRVVS